MKRMKWVCRYGFLGLLLAGCAGWGVYCQLAVTKMKNTADSLEFIDMAVSRPKEAVALLERIEQFTALRNWGLILTGVMVLCIALLATFQIVFPKIQAKPKAEKAPKAPKAPKQPKVKPEKKVAQPEPQPVVAEQVTAEQPAVAPAPVVVEEPAPQPVVEPAPVPVAEPAPKPCYCSQCGTRYEIKPPFCGTCGNPMK